MKWFVRQKNPLIYIAALAIVFAFDSYITHCKHEDIVDNLNILIRSSRHQKQMLASVAFQQSQSIISEITCEYVKPKFEQLRKNLDKNSKEIINYVEKSVINYPVKRICKFENLNLRFPESHQQYKNNWEKDVYKKVSKKYNLDGCGIDPEIFYFHHGLKFANKKIKNYIKDKDIIDCGAYIGDSVLVLKDYTDKTIFCYEFYKPNIEKFHKIMKLNNITSGYKLISVALGESMKVTREDEESLIVCSPDNKPRNSTNDIVNITTIDEEAKRHDFKVGFIKVDVEGYGLKVIKGAIDTIKKQRPVLSLAVYHNREELFETKPFLEKNLRDYVFEFHLQRFDENDMNELILFCYPKELRE
ncbi:MAG: FkbM family methyltransferase [Alphaproteobacteria bacterium]|nr:FkbM family methyltransferase [Alphaproteobacteria bacterium]